MYVCYIKSAGVSCTKISVLSAARESCDLTKHYIQIILHSGMHITRKLPFQTNMVYMYIWKQATVVVVVVGGHYII